jgi:hypothetical protein
MQEPNIVVPVLRWEALYVTTAVVGSRAHHWSENTDIEIDELLLQHKNARAQGTLCDNGSGGIQGSSLLSIGKLA